MKNKIEPYDVAIEIAFRAAIKDDIPYILNSWLNGYRPTTSKSMPKSDYFAITEPLFKSILLRSGAIIACDPADPEFIFGFVVAERLQDELIIHWINTKHIYRKAGIAKAMFRYINPANLKVIASFHVPRLLKMSKERYPYIFLPEILGRLENLPTKPIAGGLKA